MHLSVLDLVPVPAGQSPERAFANMLDLARQADRLGFDRYWIAEHHGGPRLAASAPEVLIPAVAAATARIRVGSGAVLSRYQSPLKVAELFATMGALFPGRIDLGIGRGRGATAEHSAALLDGRTPRDSEEFVLELLGYLTGSFPVEHPAAAIALAPTPATLPDVWVLGTSMWSARHAAAIGLPLAYSVFLAHDDPSAAFAAYRAEYNHDGMFPAPLGILAVDVVCADSELDARTLAFEPGDTPGIPGWGTPIIGDPPSAASELRDLANDLQVDEIMVTTLIDDHVARLRSYELLARELL